MNTAEFDAELKRLNVCLIHVSDYWLHGNPGTWPSSPTGSLMWEGNWPTFVGWWDRAVVVQSKELTNNIGRVLHEIGHAIYKEPPNAMSPESYTWMYAAEYALATRWGLWGLWDYYMDETPIEVADGGQRLWKWLSESERTKHLKYWRDLLREDGLMRHNHFMPPPVWDGDGGQNITRLPRGFHELVEDPNDRLMHTLIPSTFRLR